jgi:penicillin-binding protein 1C
VGATQHRSLRQHAGLAPGAPGTAGALASANGANQSNETNGANGARREALSPPAWWSARAGQSPAAKPAARITSPPSGTIVALDPDMPPQHQRLHFSSDASGPQAAQLRWQINGHALGRGPRLAWLPMPGRHTVQLLAADGQVLDETRIDVRGAGLLMPANGPASPAAPGPGPRR